MLFFNQRRIPKNGAKLNPNHWLTKDIAAAYVYNGGVGGMAYEATGKGSILGTSNLVYQGTGGISFPGTASNGFNLGTPPWFNPDRNFSVIVGFRPSTIDNTNYRGLVSHGVSGFYLRITDVGKLNFLESSVADIFSGTTTLVNGRDYVLGVTVSPDSTANLALYINGLVEATSTTTRTFNDTAGNLTLGHDAGGAEPQAGLMFFVYLVKRKLIPTEMMALATDPYQPYRFSPQILTDTVAAPAGFVHSMGYVF